MTEHTDLAIARVTVAGGAKSGTAFCIGPRHLLTALHVVADTTIRPPRLLGPISLRFEGREEDLKASVVPDFFDATGDWAVLSCEVPADVPRLLPLTEVAENARWSTFGYPTIDAEGLTVGGIVRNPHAAIEGPRRRLQLYCDEAKENTLLFGLSGAPCLIQGQVAGIMRRQLMGDVDAGDVEPALQGLAGTTFATPATQLMDWQRQQGLAILPPPWGPLPDTDTELRGADFLVVLSSLEPRPGTDDDGRLSLLDVARLAQEDLPAGRLAEPHAVWAEDIVASADRLLACVVALCRARVVIFDVSGWQPAIMLLAGMRAVCRRGVTLLSVGGNCQLGDELEVPHNVKDASLLVHSNSQKDESPGGDSVTLLTQRLKSALRGESDPHYLDLPVYDAVRRLGPDRRGIIPDEEGVLVLCSFEMRQQTFWKNKLRPALQLQLKRLREERGLLTPPLMGVARSFELNSPRLVTQSVFENIRRLQTCVIDLCGFRPNVLFELGVRLATSRERTVCLIDSTWAQSFSPSDARELQCRRLFQLLLQDEFIYVWNDTWQKQKVFGHAYGPAQARRAPPPLLDQALVHATVQRALDVAGEPASRPLVVELVAKAELFSRDPGQAGRTKPAGMYPGNDELTGREETADFEHLLAAFLLLRHQSSRLSADARIALRDGVEAVCTALYARHRARLDAGLQADVASLRAEVAPPQLAPLTRAPTSTAGPTTGVELPTDASGVLAAARQLKNQATAERNRGELQAAQDLLDQALTLLDPDRAAELAGSDARMLDDLLAERADTYGMKGGVYRRMGRDHLGQALVAYEAGCTIELRLQSATYNLGNVIALRIGLHGTPPQDKELQPLLRDAIAVLEKAVQGPRSDEWWAWADLAQFRLLAGETAQARQAHAQGRKLAGPSSEELGRHAQSLRELAGQTAITAPTVSAALLAAAQDLAPAT